MSYSLPMKPSEDKKVLERSLAKRYFKKPYEWKDRLGRRNLCK